MEKDWKGNTNSIFKILGANNHCDHERAERDFYATDPLAIELLYNKFWEQIGFSNSIWENACGNGHLSKKLIEIAPHISVRNSDIIKRNFDCEVIDFLQYNQPNSFQGDIITNPPYNKALEFVDESLKTVKNGYKVAMFLKLTFLEGKKRRKFFNHFPPQYVLIFSQRIQVAINGDIEMFKKSSVACYAWFIWEKGNFSKPIIDWI